MLRRSEYHFRALSVILLTDLTIHEKELFFVLKLSPSSFSAKLTSTFLLLALLSVMILGSCENKTMPDVPVVDPAEEVTTAAPEPDTTEPEETDAPETKEESEETETDPEEETDPETAAADDPEKPEETEEKPEETEKKTSEAADQETTAKSGDKPLNDFEKVSSSENEKPGEVAAVDSVAIKDGVNPLTGLYTGKDYSNKRPVAIMINNLRASLPQIGISNLDILYECLVEGGTTRLLMVVMDYEDLDVVGSVRSSRDYYIDFAQNHDAIYVHAGGSNDAYEAIQTRSINNLDGVNMYLPSTFYRDAERLKTMSTEHTLMTTGKGIVEGIAYKRYRTTLRSGFSNPYAFPEDGTTVTLDGGGTARHIIIPYNNYQFPQFIYNSKTGLYTRYQFNGQDHIDGATGEKLTFKNVIILTCDHTNLNDEKNHIAVDTTGSGKGYYCTNGKYTEIRWSKATRDSNLVLATKDGSQLVINPGQTMINIVSPWVSSNIEFNYSAK